jgi:ribonuclease HI
MHKFVTITPSNQGRTKMLQTHVVKLTTTTSARAEASKPVQKEHKEKVVSVQSTQSTQSTPSTKADIINVFTDGSCIQSSKNKQNRPAGYACVFPEFPSFNYASKLEGKEKTNNRAEYAACIMALKISNKIDPTHSSILYVHTDSELMINSLTKWLSGWKAKGWKKADGSPVKNVDLLKVMDELMKQRVVVFKHVRAHTGKTDWSSVHNDLADRMAKKAALSP